MNKEDNNYVIYLVSKNLKRIREENGLTQKELANLSNYTEGFIRNLESKSYFQTISLPTIYHLSQILDVDIREFFKPLD